MLRERQDAEEQEPWEQQVLRVAEVREHREQQDAEVREHRGVQAAWER